MTRSRVCLPVLCLLTSGLTTLPGCEDAWHHPSPCPPTLLVAELSEIQRGDEVVLTGTTSHPCSRAIVGVEALGVQALPSDDAEDATLSTWTLTLPTSVVAVAPEPDLEGADGDTAEEDSGLDGGEQEDAGQGLAAWTIGVTAVDAVGQFRRVEAQVRIDPTPDQHADGLILAMTDESGGAMAMLPADGSVSGRLWVVSEDPWSVGAALALKVQGSAAVASAETAELAAVEEGDIVLEAFPEAVAAASAHLLPASAGMVQVMATTTGEISEALVVEVAGEPEVSVGDAAPPPDATVYLGVHAAASLDHCEVRGAPSYATLEAADAELDLSELAGAEAPVDLVLTLVDAPLGAQVHVDCEDSFQQRGTGSVVVTE